MLDRSAITFADIATDDIPNLTNLMSRAFEAEFRRQGGTELREIDLYCTSDYFKRWPHGCIEADAYKITRDGVAVGGVIVWRFNERERVLGMLFVGPEYQNNGLGQHIWNFLERTYPDTERWSLASPRWASKNHYFYEYRCGFQRVGDDGDHYIYEKLNSQ